MEHLKKQLQEHPPSITSTRRLEATRNVWKASNDEEQQAQNSISLNIIRVYVNFVT